MTRAPCVVDACNAESAEGHNACAGCLADRTASKRARRHLSRPVDVSFLEATGPRPAWLDNPALLPKRPPGRA